MMDLLSPRRTEPLFSLHRLHIRVSMSTHEPC